MPASPRPLLLAALAVLSACASPAPPLHLHSLTSLAAPQGGPPDSPSAAPALPALPTTAPAAAATPVWQLLAVQLPAYLDRDTLLVPAPSGGLQALANERWAEPLRDALPRLLRDDLASLRGAASVWAAPLPVGLQVQRQLRVEVLALDVLPGWQAVRLRARWWLADVAPPTATTAVTNLSTNAATNAASTTNITTATMRSDAPLLGEADLQAGVAGSSAAALVAAHRAVLWQLAGRIAANTTNAVNGASTASATSAAITAKPPGPASPPGAANTPPR